MGRRVTVRRDDLQALLKEAGTTAGAAWLNRSLGEDRMDRLREAAEGPSVFVGVYADVVQEQADARVKHGPAAMDNRPWNDSLCLPILAEEVGEVAKELCDSQEHGGVVDTPRLYRELVQVAAMAISWASNVKAQDDLKAGVDQ